MRKTKKLILLSICLIVLGITMAIIGLLSGGHGSIVWGKDGLEIYDKANIIKENNELEKFNDVNIDVDFGDIEVIKSDKYAIEVEYNKEVEELTYKVENEKLTVSNNRWGKRFFSMGFIDNNTLVKVYIPENVALNNLDIQNKSGNLIVDNIEVKNSNINCDFGNATINNITGDKINLTGKSGKVYTKNLKLEELVLYVDFGDVISENINTTTFESNLKSGTLDIKTLTANNAKINSDFGDVKGIQLVTNGLLVRAKSGEINIDGELKGDNTLDCDFGDITIKTSLPKNEYSYKVDMDFGTNKIDNKEVEGDVEEINTGASNNFNINCKSGDLKIDFVK
ncbi:hypothetical protein UT300007_29960 [Clostridium sp. CTA-7]